MVSPTCIRCQNGPFGQKRGAFGGITRVLEPAGSVNLTGARIEAGAAERGSLKKHPVRMWGRCPQSSLAESAGANCAPIGPDCSLLSYADD